MEVKSYHNEGQPTERPQDPSPMELQEDLQLAEQLINWILKYFNLEIYDWRYDQNEISTLIEDYVEGLKKKVTEAELDK